MFHTFLSLKLKGKSRLPSNTIFQPPFLPIHMFMQQLEDALNVSLWGHVLFLLAAVRFKAFSIVNVHYKKFCMLRQYKTLIAEM